jgi:hypothetical protein
MEVTLKDAAGRDHGGGYGITGVSWDAKAGLSITAEDTGGDKLAHVEVQLRPVEALRLAGELLAPAIWREFRDAWSERDKARQEAARQEARGKKSL